MALGILQVASEGELQAIEQADITAAEESRQEQMERDAPVGLAGYIHGLWRDYRNARTQQSVDTRINNALRSYNGQYSPSKLAEIRRFGGSEVYSRLITVKCRGTTAMLRDVFLSSERPWGLTPTAVPDVPDSIADDIDRLIMAELQQLQAMGMAMPSEAQVEQRRDQLLAEAFRQTVEKADHEARKSERALQDILEEGEFYQALAEFLIDLPIYPFACLKGPVVQMTTDLTWQDDGTLTTEERPKMFWRRVDPINLYYTPGATTIEEASVLERMKMSRADFNALLGVPGYNEDAIRGVLRDYSSGLRDWLDNYDTEQAYQKAQEDPNRNVSELIDCLEFHGAVQGKTLLDEGFSEELIDDEDRDYYITAWVVGNYVIKIQMNRNPNRRPIYYISSFEKVPGSIVGHGLPEIINDIEEVGNAALRALANNMSIASGPQVGLNEDLLSPTMDADSLYPWKRWKFIQDPMGQNMPPISFFQPQMHANELLGIYQAMATLADEISAIPRYMTGSSNAGGAASTASGLSMLMNNASKVLQNIAANIDRDIMYPVLQMLYDIVMLTDTAGILKGDEDIVVQGVSVALQRETDRMRQLEFLQITGNPIDMEIMGYDGRAAVLRELSRNLGMDGQKIIPTDAELQERQAQRMAEQQAMLAAQAQGSQPPAPGSTNTQVAAPLDNMQRTRNMGG